jgi:hypothetical protein
LAGQVLLVEPGDRLGGRAAPLVLRVVPVAQEELPAGGRMIAHPPAAGLVAVVLLHQLIRGGADRPDGAELGQVGPESGPEPVVRAGRVVRPGVHGEPVIHGVRVQEPRRQAGRCRQPDDEENPEAHSH